MCFTSMRTLSPVSWASSSESQCHTRRVLGDAMDRGSYNEFQAIFACDKISYLRLNNRRDHFIGSSTTSTMLLLLCMCMITVIVMIITFPAATNSTIIVCYVPSSTNASTRFSRTTTIRIESCRKAILLSSACYLHHSRNVSFIFIWILHCYANIFIFLLRFFIHIYIYIYIFSLAFCAIPCCRTAGADGGHMCVSRLTMCYYY